MANVPFFFDGDRKVFVSLAANRTAALAAENPSAHYQEIGGLLYQSNGSAWIPVTTGDVMAGGQFASGTLADGNAVIIPMAGARLGCVVWTEPVVGDTVTVSYSYDGGTTYYEWPHGPVTSTSTDKADTVNGAITHVKFQRTGGAGTTSTYGVTQ